MLQSFAVAIVTPNVWSVDPDRHKRKHPQCGEDVKICIQYPEENSHHLLMHTPAGGLPQQLYVLLPDMKPVGCVPQVRYGSQLPGPAEVSESNDEGWFPQRWLNDRPIAVV